MYFKITNELENHHGLQYQDGIVEDILPFNSTGSCCPGGIYFSDDKNIMKFSHYGPWVRQVEIPEDAKWVEDPDGNKWRASKLFFHPRKDLWTVETIQWLMAQDVNINNYTDSILTEGAKRNSIELVKFAITQEVNVKLCSSALKHSVSNNNSEMLSFLLDNGGDINCGLLSEAAEHNSLEMAKFVINKGADIKLISNQNALSDFAAKGNIEAVEYLMSKGMNIHFQDEKALRISAAHGQTEMVKFLLDKGADINAGNHCALVLSVKYAYLNVLQLLFEKGVDFNSYKKSLINYSVDLMDIEIMKFLVEKGCDIHGTNDYVLKTAIEQNNKEVINYIKTLK